MDGRKLNDALAKPTIYAEELVRQNLEGLYRDVAALTSEANDGNLAAWEMACERLREMLSNACAVAGKYRAGAGPRCHPHYAHLVRVQS